MEIFSASFNGVSATPSTKSYKISLIADETQREGLLKLANNLTFGSEVLVLVFDLEKERKDIENLNNESPEDTKKRFNRMLHARIREVAVKKGVSEDELKKELKSYLIEKKLIKTTTADLDIGGYAIAIQYISKK
jgi:hypothetical protein